MKIRVSIFSIFLFSFFLFSVSSFASPSIKIRLILSKEINTQKYFFASNINGWNPSSSKFQFVKTEQGFYELELREFKNINIEYKITKGSWDLVEVSKDGKDIENRRIAVSKISKDTIISIEVLKWKDEFGNTPKVSTASKNVKIISENFQLKRLGKERRIWVYTPQSYYTDKNKKYPVMYMHDGQNLFDELTGAFGEWGVDECMDTLGALINFEMIIVGIDNGMSERLSEYSAYDFRIKNDDKSELEIKAKGDKYLESIVYDLKPFIDKNYRTKTDSKNTIICGSSMGGLISMYGIIRYPEVFGAAGVFSPAYWTNKEELINEIEKDNSKWKGNVYMIVGELEGKRYVDDMNEVSELLRVKNKENIESKTISAGRHNESFWRSEFASFLFWLSKIN